MKSSNHSIRLNYLTKEQLFKLLGIILLSDGYVHKTNGVTNSIRLITSGYNRCQHELFNYLCKKTFGKPAKIYQLSKNKMLMSEFFSRNILDKVYSLSPTYQTSPSKYLKKEEYLKTKQPTLIFIKNEPLEFKWLAFLLYFEFDGSISPSIKLKYKNDLKKSKLYKYYQVQLEFEIRIAETNPQLNKELICICSELGLKANKTVNKRNWSGIEGIRISNMNSVKKFIEKDTITKVKISSKSYRFRGLTKSSIIKSTKNIIEEIPLSKSFKTKSEAEKYREDLNIKLLNYIHNSPVG